MIWLTWRQFRGSATMMAALLVVVAAVMALTGPQIADDYTTGLAKCVQEDTCAAFFDGFFEENITPFMVVTLAVLLIPAIAGLFWGAPLITRELEAGTHLLVWNQSVTRTRWLAVKLVLTGLAAVGAACVCGLVVTWWSQPLDKSAGPGWAVMDPLVFSARGIVPMGYAAFAFVLGVTMGVVFRRTLPAMALTLAVFAAVQVAMPLLVRPHLAAPVTSTFELSTENVDGIGISTDGRMRVTVEPVIPGHTGAWVLTSNVVDSSGKVIDDGKGEAEVKGVSSTSGPCGAPGAGSPNLCNAEISRHGYRQLATYQPLERFWPFQWIETGIYALLTAGMTGLCFWVVRRRLS
ncbi:ABC transporter permease subunit [Microtetraspora sp. AC03309]|uniref:ABC transporter permease n=1 Tax=Microtetraspora sp. AC03309 TaxID=2779376 RepID=UPI001E3000AB|nr:ABC transporter permease [Microtetraspora sp. AC03309]MCC5575788.1 ABC transporter permease subunit [Microtetraspora sp. AC03309]